MYSSSSNIAYGKNNMWSSSNIGMTEALIRNTVGITNEAELFTVNADNTAIETANNIPIQATNFIITGTDEQIDASETNAVNKRYLKNKIDNLDNKFMTKAQADAIYETIVDSEDGFTEVRNDIALIKQNINNKLDSSTAASTYETIANHNSDLAGLANTYVSITDFDSAIQELQTDKVDVNNVYTKTQVDDSLSLKANSADVYDKTTSDNKYFLQTNVIDTSGTASNNNVYSASAVDTKISNAMNNATTTTVNFDNSSLIGYNYLSGSSTVSTANLCSTSNDFIKGAAYNHTITLTMTTDAYDIDTLNELTFSIKLLSNGTSYQGTVSNHTYEYGGQLMIFNVSWNITETISNESSDSGFNVVVSMTKPSSLSIIPRTEIDTDRTTVWNGTYTIQVAPVLTYFSTQISTLRNKNYFTETELTPITSSIASMSNAIVYQSSVIRNEVLNKHTFHKLYFKFTLSSQDLTLNGKIFATLHLLLFDSSGNVLNNDNTIIADGIVRINSTDCYSYISGYFDSINTDINYAKYRIVLYNYSGSTIDISTLDACKSIYYIV